MDLPVRSAKFVPRKNWVVTGSDDMQIRVFNYNTLERIHSFEAHSDYVRCIAIHPTQPYILTCSGMFYSVLLYYINFSFNILYQEEKQIVIFQNDIDLFACINLLKVALCIMIPNFTYLLFMVATSVKVFY